MPERSGMIKKVVADRHSTMLIIGRGETYYSLKEISYETEYAAVLKKYGESELSRSFKIAREFGAEHIFLLNLKDSKDYADIKNVIPQTDFTYIVPVSVNMSDFFVDEYRNNAKIPYVSYLVALTSMNRGESVVIATDIHASLYEDEDAFIKAQEKAERFVTKALNPACNRENLVFTANNLEKYEKANVVLAAVLCATDIPEYPQADFGKAVLNLDGNDTAGSWGFFKNHVSGTVSYENFLNGLQTGNPKKIGSVSRISKMIKREMDFSECTGKLYSEYQRLCIYRKIESYLSRLKDYVITDYRIKHVTPYKDRGVPSLTIKAEIDVLPKGCLEWIHLSKDIEVI